MGFPLLFASHTGKSNAEFLLEVTECPRAPLLKDIRRLEETERGQVDYDPWMTLKLFVTDFSALAVMHERKKAFNFCWAMAFTH